MRDRVERVCQWVVRTCKCFLLLLCVRVHVRRASQRHFNVCPTCACSFRRRKTPTKRCDLSLVCCCGERKTALPFLLLLLSFFVFFAVIGKKEDIVTIHSHIVSGYMRCVNTNRERERRRLCLGHGYQKKENNPKEQKDKPKEETRQQQQQQANRETTKKGKSERTQETRYICVCMYGGRWAREMV